MQGDLKAERITIVGPTPAHGKRQAVIWADISARMPQKTAPNEAVERAAFYCVTRISMVWSSRCGAGMAAMGTLSKLLTLER